MSLIHREDLEWDDLQPGNEPFTPDNYHANLARQLAEGQNTEAPFVSNFARKLARNQKELECRLSSVPVTTPNTPQSYQLNRNMEESNTKYQTERQKLLQAQTQALDPGPWKILGLWQDSNTLDYPEDNRKELPKVPQPQGILKLVKKQELISKLQ